jgi:urea transport system ATP-binding protein
MSISPSSTRRQIANLGIGRKFQKPTVFEPHRARQLLLALKNDRARAHAVLARDAEANATRIDSILEIIRLTDHRDRLAGGLSHGQKQWLEIGMLLAQEPKLLLVDEPVAGMTDAETHQTAELLREINRSVRWSWSSTTWTSCANSASRSPCLHEGSVLAEGTIDQVSANPRVIEVYLGR